MLSCTPSYALLIAEALGRTGSAWRLATRGRSVRRRALVRADARPDRAPARPARAKLLWPLGDHRARRRDRVCGDRRRAHERGPLPREVVDGELVITTLTRKALPLLRYRTGDMAAIDRAACACGRTLARMGRVQGRRDDMLILRGVNVYPSEIEHVLLGHRGRRAALRAHRPSGPGASDEVRVRCEARAGGDERSPCACTRRCASAPGSGSRSSWSRRAPSRAARARPRGSSTSAEAQGSVVLCATPPCVHVTVTSRPTAFTRTCAMSSGAATVAISWTTPFITSVAAPKRAHLRRRVAVADDR